MKIGVNARLLEKYYTGIGQWTRNIFAELGRIDKKNEYVLIVPEEVKLELPANVKVKVVPEQYKKLGRFSAGIRKLYWEQVLVPEVMKEEGCDVAFFTYPSNPWKRDFYKKFKTLMVVHDCIPWVERDYWNGIFSWWKHMKTKRAVKLVDQIITVSKSSKKDIAKVCGVAADKISVIYNDAAEVYKQKSEPERMARVLKGYGLKPRGYFLYCGGYDERKNVAKLVDQYSMFSGEHDEIDLVLTGDKLLDGRLYVSLAKASAECEGRIVRTGFINAEELVELYAGCLAFIHLSRSEGFNIPLIEAANQGAPLIVSDIEVHHEIVGDNALYVSDLAVGAMEKIMDPKVRESYSEKARRAAERYSWKDSAGKVAALLSERFM